MNNSIKIYRKKQNISQDILAKKIGVSRKTINDIENSKTIPNIKLALKIAKCFKTEITNLFNIVKNCKKE